MVALKFKALRHPKSTGFACSWTGTSGSGLNVTGPTSTWITTHYIRESDFFLYRAQRGQQKEQRH